MTETALHISVAQYLDMALPESATWTTIGHGGGGKTRGAKLKQMGVKPGWPDIIILHKGIAWGCYTFATYFIELKTEKGRLSKHQKAAHAQIRNAGGIVAVCRSIPEVEGTLRGWGIPLKAHAA